MATALTLATPLLGGQTGSPASANAAAASDGLASATFDVASIRLDKPGPGNRISTRISFPPSGAFTASGVTLRKLLSMAYAVDEAQILGDPTWLSSDRYTVVGKPSPEVGEQMMKLAGPQRTLAARHMLQTLFAERLQLTAHSETRQLPILALTVAKGGPNLHESAAVDSSANSQKGPDGKARNGMMRLEPGKLNAQGISMDGLAIQLTDRLHHLVQNKTGLTGIYDFTLEWSPEENHDAGPEPPPAGGGNAPDSTGPSLFTALQEQLGLKLESQKGPVPVLVIDHVEKPSEN